jgi:predicted short-subunit dehydrogenase-like oxidoreductase (DUF2520 family)
MPSFRLIGPGRAGRSLATALTQRGWRDAGQLGRGDDIAGAANGVGLLVIATPDAVIPDVARSVVRVDGTAVAHLSGSLGLDVLAPHRRRCAIHPLVSLADPATGAARLLAGARFAVAGDAMAATVVDALGGIAFPVADEDRAAYHAAACIAANHVVALLGQVERVAATAGVPLEAFLGLARGAIDNVAEFGAAAALTGPVARGDWVTIERHLAALDPAEHRAYEAMVDLAARLDARGANVRQATA